MYLIISTLIVTHITIVCVTLFLHRGQAHKGIIFHPVPSKVVPDENNSRETYA